MMNKTKMAMILFIASEGIFFSMLVAAYVYFHIGPKYGPGAAQVLNPYTPTDLTFRLIGFLNRRDLRLVATSPNLPPPLCNAARRLLERDV